MITNNSSIDEGDGDKIFSNSEADSACVNKVNNNNNKNNGTCINDRVSFDKNSQTSHHHLQQDKQKCNMEEQLKDPKSTDQSTKKANVISGDSVSVNNETVQNGSSFLFGDPNQPSK